MTTTKRHFLLAFVLLFTAISCIESKETMQFENQVIEQVDVLIEGESSSSDFYEQAVKARIKTKTAEIFSQAEFDRDLKALAKEFDYVEPSLRSRNGRLFITLKVWPKPIIRTICFDGNKRISSQDLLQELAICNGETFDRQSFNQAFHKLKAHYVKNGFFEAQLTYRTVLDEACNEVDVYVCVNEGRAGRVKQICFRGFCTKHKTDIVDMMITKEYNFFTSWMTGEGTFNEEAVQQDQFIILDYLHNRGYADAEVSIEVCDAKEADRIVIIITANKGCRYHFGNVSFEGNTVFDDSEICRNVAIKCGDFYSPEKLRNTIRRITDLYGKCGYIDAIVSYEPKLDPETHCYNVHFKIDEGEQYRVGMIKVFGNICTKTNVILHETLLVPGQVFNINKLKLTEMRLCNIGYFKNVNVYAVRTEDGPSCLNENYRDIHIEIEETSTGHFGLFSGLSNSEGIFTGFSLTERNFNIGGLGRFGTHGFRALRGGGEYAHITTTFGSKNRKYMFSWTKPHFRDTPWSVGFEVDNQSNREISNDYEINSWNFNTHAILDCNAFLKLSYHYRFSNSNIRASGNASPAIKRQAENQGLISAVGTSLSYDSSNSIMRPTCGLRSQLMWELAGVGGEYFFHSLGYTNTYYHQVDDRGVLKLRADARFIFPIKSTTANNLPINERFFMGGENEIRGFRPFSIGPKFPDDDPRGGISLQLLSAEYQRRVWKMMDFFTFIDAGHLSLREFDFGRLYTSVGFGVRLAIMADSPPVTLGFGWPINATNDTDIKRFFFMMGGRF